MITSIKGSTGNVYKIDDQGHGAITCTCPDFIYRHAVQGGYCKHIVSYIELSCSTKRADILKRARAAKQAKRAAQQKRAAHARAARALQRAGIQKWRGYIAPKHEDMAIVAPWRAHCAGNYTIRDSYHKYQDAKIVD
jgi:hypothetical protein